MKKLLSVALLACTAQAMASTLSTPVLLESPIAYAPGASVVEQVKQECKIENMLESHIGPTLGKLNGTGVGTAASAADAKGASVLRVQITYVMGVGGGAWSGPKSISVKAELLDQGKVTRQTNINRWTTGGMFGGFKGTCSILDRSATAIAKDLGRWVSDPSYQIKEEPTPKGVEASGTETAAR